MTPPLLYDGNAHNMLLLRLSTLTLALAHVTSQSWLRHIVVSNSIVGSVYMVVEMERLRTEGSQGPEAYFGYGTPPPV